MTTNAQKLTAFAQAVGQDIKELKAQNAQNASLSSTVQDLQTQKADKQQVATDIANAKRELKNELMGGDVDAQLDTLKEIGDKFKELENNAPVSSAITEKLTEHKQSLDTHTQEINTLKEAVNFGDLLTTYNQAKGA